MIFRLLLAGLHLLALGVGLGAVWGRARALRDPLDDAGFGRLFRADAWWGVAGMLWLVTGLIRLFTSVEKGSAYYLHNHLFLTKMALFIAIVVLEVGAVRTIGAWRAALRRGDTPDTTRAAALSRISRVQAGIIVAMVFLAAAMARGIG